MTIHDQDYTGHFGPSEGMTEYRNRKTPKWPMYSFDRPSIAFWNSFANALRDAGATDKAIGEILGSTYIRHIMNGEEECLERLGKRIGKENSEFLIAAQKNW